MTARIDAISAVSFYVRTDGSDGNNGLTNDASGAFRTPQAAINNLYNNYDMRGFAASIRLSDGDFDPFSVIGTLQGSNNTTPLSVIGNTATPGNVRIAPSSGQCVSNLRSVLFVSGMKLSTTGAGGAIFGNEFGETTWANVEFGAVGGSHVFSAAHHVVAPTGAYTISGGAKVHWHITGYSQLFSTVAVTLTNTPNFSSEFLGMNTARATLIGTTFSGAATGVRHLIHYNSYVETGGKEPANYLPGNAAGSVDGGTFSLWS